MHPSIEKLVNSYPNLSRCTVHVERAFELMRDSFRQGGKLLLCGNGGSASDCEHIVGELLKQFVRKRCVSEEFVSQCMQHYGNDGSSLVQNLQGGLPALSLASQTSFLSAFCNDASADYAFAQQVYVYGQPGDVLMVLSTSGTSANVIHALKVARVKGMFTVGLTGLTGGHLPPLCDAVICVPFQATPEVQECHLPIYHTLCSMLEEEFF